MGKTTARQGQKRRKPAGTKPPGGGITSPKGFRAAGTTCGIKPSGRPDLALIVADVPCTAAGVLTRNKLPGAPLIIARRHLRRGTARAILCNSGIANDATGDEGLRNAEQTCRLVAQNLGDEFGDYRQVLPASTGVIGPQLPMDNISRGIATLANRLERGRSADRAAATAIMTTDLVPKSAHVSLVLAGRRIELAGIAKGSGMIAPNLATMLVFLTTDAAISVALLQRALREAAADSFNRISVDQHTSPSDMVLILASGLAGNKAITSETRDYGLFAGALTDLCKNLAYQIVRDGEGATKVFRVRVEGAKSVRDADRVGQAIVNSPLVKAAVHGGDPNWGRIVTAAGYSGAAIKPGNMSLHIGGEREVCVFRAGQPVPANKTTLRRLTRLMAAKEVVVSIDLGMGKAAVEWLGCDLSKEYVTINAEYTT